jgi:adenine-specific DNA-methyltransferase
MKLIKNINPNTIKTVGIKYTGSKLKILPYILALISDLEAKTIFDGFSGSTRVSQAFAKKGYKVISNDISAWSQVFAKCFLLAPKSKENFYKGLIDELNSLEGYDGWFTTHYGGDELTGTKMPFQKKNTRKLDAIRTKIEEYKLNDIDEAVLLTSLLMALDKVDSTLGHFAAYLSQWSPRSYKDLKLELPPLEDHKVIHDVLRGDVFDSLKNKNFDIAYYDPPYGSNNEKMPPSRVRYASYYHIWTTVVLNDKPQIFGKVNRREDSRDIKAGSIFEEFKKDPNGKFIATEAIKKLIEKTTSKYIVFSYSNGGRATQQELFDIFNTYSNVKKFVEIDYKKNVMSTMRWTNEWIPDKDKKNTEYLFLLEKKE